MGKAHSSPPISRREFLGQASCAAVGSSALFSTLLTLRLANSLSAQTAPASGDYKALVCLFLAGGNDSWNMLVPTTAGEYAAYAKARANLALAPDTILGLLETAHSQARAEQSLRPSANGHHFVAWLQDWLDGEAPTNVWLGTTIEEPTGAEKRIKDLLKVPAAVRFLSSDLSGPMALTGGSTHIYQSGRKEILNRWLAHGPTAEAFLMGIMEHLQVGGGAAAGHVKTLVPDGLPAA